MNFKRILFTLSTRPDFQEELIDRQLTFYSAAISHAYYVIFFSAKAYLKKQGIATRPPREHEQVHDRFKWFVESGVLDKELLRIYNEERIKAATLLDIFKIEKQKRGAFTYKKLPEANRKPAEESVSNAERFFKEVVNLCE